MDAGIMTGLVGLADLIGVKGIYDAIEGEDSITLTKYCGADRWEAGFGGGLKLALTALGLKGAATPARNGGHTAVSRWGRPGLQPGDWVMKGPANWWNYLQSGKWQPGFGNQFASKGSGQTFRVPKMAVKWPSGWGIDGWWKALFGQRKYSPTPPGGAP